LQVIYVLMLHKLQVILTNASEPVANEGDFLLCHRSILPQLAFI